MSLRRDDATTLDHRHVLSVSVIDCDAKDCDKSFLVGPGDGITLSEEDFENIEAEGWVAGDRDYCPKHKGLCVRRGAMTTTSFKGPKLWKSR